MPAESKPMRDIIQSSVNIMAHGDRRMLEAVYLELREFAQQNLLKLEYRLSPTEPDDKADA
jgi:hypothetical protein